MTKLNEMKHLLTLAALLVSTLSLAQFTPYNPDADNDQFVGAQDLLAFLPLFGEEWNLDSLNVYGVSELSPPGWCDAAPNGNACDIYRVVPSDADIVYHDLEENKRLLLPEVPKPMIVFGGDDEPSFLSYWENGQSGDTLVTFLNANGNPYFTVLTGFAGNWYIQR